MIIFNSFNAGHNKRNLEFFLAPYDINEEVDCAVGREVVMETGTVPRLQPIRSQYTEVER